MSIETTLRMRTPPVLLVALLGACAAPAEHSSVSDAPGSAIDAFFERVFVERLERSPTLQSTLGIKDDNDKWTEQSEEFQRETYELEKGYLAELAQFDSAELSRAERLSYRLFDYDTRFRIEQYRWRHYYYPVEHRNGVQSYVPSFLINMHRIDTPQDAEAYIARLRGVGELFEQTIGQMKLAAAKDIVPPKFVLRQSIESARKVIVGRPFDETDADSALRADFVKKIGALDIGRQLRQTLLVEADRVLREHTAPAYENLIDYLALLEQRATTEDGVWKFPDGAAFYAFELSRRTTTSLAAPQIHAFGLAEVARIHDEMRLIMNELGCDGTLPEFFEYMRSEPRFYYPNNEEGREQYLARATAIIDEMRGRLDELFTVRPKAELLVKRVEPFRERRAGKAFYQRPAPDGSRPGVYYANLYNMANMPIYQMQALAYHEGIPGHHMQIAIQQELEGIPRFRRFGRFTAYSEGWGLYSEWLPSQISAYKDPYSDFGRLAMELWRACRLVVDTGIHDMRWTREQAIAYLGDNTPNAYGDIVNAVERYIVMPAQATAYKIGMLKIQELRARAERELGEDFDVRLFHDAVLANGPVPLIVLEALIAEHIENRQQSLRRGPYSAKID